MEKYVLVPRSSDKNTISSLLGISAGFATIIFFLASFSIKVASPRINDGVIVFNGDPSLMYLMIFLALTTLILSAQNRLQTNQEKVKS